jgi:glutaredoxin
MFKEKEMKEAKIEVFTSPTCPFCPGAVKVAEELAKDMPGIKVVETSMGTEKGRKRAQNNDVRSVPTLFITGTGYPDRIGYVGAPSKDKLKKMVNIATGNEKWEEPVSFFARLTKRLKIKI